MRTERIIGASLEELKEKKLNIIIGISLGNKYFSKENLKNYIEWAIENTKEYVGVLIADIINSVNYEVRWGYNEKRAMSVAMRKGMEFENVIREIIEELPYENREIIKIFHWNDILDKTYKDKLKVVYREFKENKEFHDVVMDVVMNNANPDVMKLDKKDYEKLAEYVLNEIPLLVCGINKDNIYYGLLPYPGIGKIDELVDEIHRGKRFKELRDSLNITNRMVILEAYVD